MSRLEFIYYLSTSILSILMISGFVWFIISLICIRSYERKILVLKEKINNLPKQIQERIKNHIINQSQFERIVENERKLLFEELEKLETKKGFILDKLPFIK